MEERSVMPYKLQKTGKGFKVCKKAGGKCFSKKPLPKERAKAQMAAIYANESVFNRICNKFLRGA